jgi:transcriptional regulator with XRE-family HTH domain
VSLQPSTLPVLRQHRPETAFAVFLRQRRADAGKTLKDFSEATGLSRTYLWGLEHGRHVPNLLIAGKLSEAYGANIQTLYRLLMADEDYYDALRSGKARK